MFGRPFVYIVFLLVPFLLTSCGGEEPQEPEVQIKQVAKPPEPTDVVEEEKEEAAPEPVTFPAKKMRNPFQTFIVKKTPVGPTRIKGPLECCDIKLFKVMAVVSGIDEPRALVLAPDGKKYTVKQGDRMGTKDGKIIAIKDKSIIVKELVRDLVGNVVSTENVEISLPEGKKP
jgi:type IV pilus assembly protein PilP